MDDTVKKRQRELKKVEEAITKLQIGQRISSVSYDGHSVSYASITLDELLQQRQRLLSQIAGGQNKSKRQILFSTHKGVRL